MPPKSLLVPSRGPNLNDEMAKTVGKYIKLETMRSIEGSFDNVALKKSVSNRQARKPHLNAVRNKCSPATLHDKDIATLATWAYTVNQPCMLRCDAAPNLRAFQTANANAGEKYSDGWH